MKNDLKIAQPQLVILYIVLVLLSFYHSFSAMSSLPSPQNNDDNADLGSGNGVKRISISLIPETFDLLDKLVEERGFHSRSQAVSEMVHQSVIDYHETLGDVVVAGTIMLVYDEGRPGLQEMIAGIQRQHISEVISSQRILLENIHTLEVLLVQGPGAKLKAICDELITCKGVQFGRLTVTSAILPPLHSSTSNTETESV
jgi:CopG family nickel-responsive transcriptional regulator